MTPRPATVRALVDVGVWSISSSIDTLPAGTEWTLEPDHSLPDGYALLTGDDGVAYAVRLDDLRWLFMKLE